MNAMNLSVNDAVAVAMDYVGAFGPIFPAKGLRLEETELEDSGNWRITLSFMDDDTLGGRVYKTFLIDPDTKEVRAMKIREPSAVPF